MKDPTGKPAPAGGFQTGGWYSGYQYWDGSFAPTAGQIHPSSNQPGAGGAAYVAPKDVSFIEAERAKTSAAPTTKEEVTPYLADFQDSLFKASTAPEVKIPTMEGLKTELAPTTAAPDLLNRVEEFEKLRTTYGVADLEKSLTDVKAKIETEMANLRTARGIEEGKPVPMGVISGRISEEERVAQERVDFLTRQKARTTDELNTKYGIINTYMTLKGLDYQDAVSAYDKEFTHNLQLYDIILGAKKEARSAYEYDQTAARANLQIYANAAISGNISYSNLSADQKLMISKLEIQSGLPIGTIANMGLSAKDKILAFNEDKTQAWVIGDDGKMKVIQTGMRVSVGTGSDTKNIRAQFTAASTLTSKTNFPDLVEKFANVMTLEEIYQAYANSEMGKKYGTPIESAQVIKLTYKVAKGEMSEKEAREELGY